MFIFCRKVRSVLVAVFVFFLVIFWMVPVAFVSSLIQLESLARYEPLRKSMNLSIYFIYFGYTLPVLEK